MEEINFYRAFTTGRVGREISGILGFARVYIGYLRDKGERPNRAVNSRVYDPPPPPVVSNSHVNKRKDTSMKTRNRRARIAAIRVIIIRELSRAYPRKRRSLEIFSRVSKKLRASTLRRENNLQYSTT